MHNHSKKNNLGILGGTFDPPHFGHLHISKVSLKILKLNRLIWAITKKNPLKKKPHLNIKTRIKLSKKITNNEEKIIVKSFDKKIKSENTYDLLNYIKRKQKSSNLYFLIGADNLPKLHKWNNWKKIPELAKIVVFPRGNHLSKRNKYIAAKSLKKKDIIYINSKKVSISSSLIRKFW